MRPPVIVGGGPAGSAAAIHLVRAGIGATLLERNAQVGDALCGGFLSWQTAKRLTGLGLDLDALDGHPIERMAIFVGDREYGALLPAPAIGLSRRSLDSALLALARREGTDVRLGTGVRTADALQLRLDSGETLTADTLFLATGKHDLRGLSRDAAMSTDPWLGLRVRLPPSPARSRLLAHRIELHVFQGGYAGLMLQEDGSANFCLATTKRTLAARGGTPFAFMARLAASSAALAVRLEGLPDHVDAIGHVPYGWRARTSEPGIFRLGDQAGVIPSFAGEGIGIALASAEAAVAAWRHGGSQAAPSYQHRVAADLARPIGVARLITAVTSRPALARALLPLAMRTRIPHWLAGATRSA
jgi:flavin-dependent dehydrogenase